MQARRSAATHHPHRIRLGAEGGAKEERPDEARASQAPRDSLFRESLRLSASVLFSVVFSLSPATRSDSEAGQASFSTPQDLVVDIRLFEARSVNPDYAAMRTLHFFISTDGREVRAEQWLATLAKKVPDSFLAALAFDTVPAGKGTALSTWPKGSRVFESEIRLHDYHPTGIFKANARVRFTRRGETLREIDREIELQLGRTTVWSHENLEMSASDYISHFRDYESRDHRGQLYERLREYTLFLVLAATPRLLTAEEAREPPPVRVSLPPNVVLPELESPFPIPLLGRLVIGFQVDPTGTPVNPQIVRSTVPEANPRFLGEARQWQFPEAKGKRAEVEVEVRLP